MSTGQPTPLTLIVGDEQQTYVGRSGEEQLGRRFRAF